MKPLLFATAFAAAAAVPGAQAGEVYGSLGTTGVLIGWGQSVGERFKLRADVSTLGSHRDEFEEDGIDYDGRFKSRRLGLFADWFFAAGSHWRLTGGVTFNDIRLDLTSRGTGGTIEIGGTTYTLTAADRFDVRIKMPRTTPYLGIGYAIPPSSTSGRGWSFNFDLGAMIGKARVDGSVSGPLAGLVSQADVDAELAQIRGNAGNIKAWPQISFGASYRF